MQNFARNWPVCTEFGSFVQMAQKWKNFADFLAILLQSSALTTAAALTDEFDAKLDNYLVEVCASWLQAIS